MKKLHLYGWLFSFLMMLPEFIFSYEHSLSMEQQHPVANMEMSTKFKEALNLNKNGEMLRNPPKIRFFVIFFLYTFLIFFTVLMWNRRPIIARSCFILWLGVLGLMLFIIINNILAVAKTENPLDIIPWQIFFSQLLIALIMIWLAKYVNTIQNEKEKALQDAIQQLTALNELKEAYSLQLEQEVWHRTQEIENRNQKLKQLTERLKTLDAKKTHFFACISHEFRTPITLIQGPLQAIKNGRYGQVSETCSEQIALAIRNTQRLALFVEQILDLTRLDAGYFRINVQQIDIASWVRMIHASFESQAKQKKITLELAAPENLHGHIDPIQFEKVVFNLLSNAIKFTPRNGHILISLSTKESSIILKISDNGIGLSEKAKQKCFNMFYQASEQNYLEGLGIGLTLAKEITELHQGRIGLESKLNKGTTITITLPNLAMPIVLNTHEPKLQIATPEEIRAFPAKVEPDGQSTLVKPTLLIAEDNPDMQIFLLSGLQENYHITLVNNGNEAWQSINAQLPDLLLTDWRMPEMDGLTLLEKIRNKAEICTLPVIILTGNASSEERKKGYASLADDYLTKPFDMDDLLIRLQAVLQVRQYFYQMLTFLPSSINELNDQEDLSYVSADQKLLKNINLCIEKNLSDVNFDCDSLAAKLYMTPKTLSRRLLKITGQTPGLYIREQRLAKAREYQQAQTFRTQKELALAVGFKSSGYFSKLYKARFPACSKLQS